jgi:FKBP-type peptidyl-prolyl cis-trans isomerase
MAAGIIHDRRFEEIPPMSSRVGALASLSLILVLCWGCGPPSMVPVAPPGLEFQAVTPEKDEEEPAEAIGENRTALSTASPSAALVKGDSPTQGGAGAAEKPSQPLAEPTEPGQTKTTASGLKYETIKPGTGATAQPGRTAVVHYTGTLTDGTKFDSSRDRGQPFPVALGRGQVIKGWEEGLAGMKVGEVRKLTIPPNLAYGDNPPPGAPIPPGATLVFEVELMDVK